MSKEETMFKIEQFPDKYQNLELKNLDQDKKIISFLLEADKKDSFVIDYMGCACCMDIIRSLRPIYRNIR